MGTHTVLVLVSDLADPDLALLEQLPPETNLAVGGSVEAFERLAGDADVILSWTARDQFLQDVFRKCPRVKWVHARFAGLDKVLFPELVASPVTLTNGRGMYSAALGEFAIGAILYFAKGFRRLVASQMAGQWDQFDVDEISEQTLGIVGYGDIGRAVASRARALGMQILAIKRHGPPLYNVDPMVSQIFRPEDRAEMLARCDYVVVSTPLTPETRGMIGPREFAAMKPNAVVINIARGPVIDEGALIDALRERRIKGAALDVYDVEPLPAGHPFYSLDNVLLSPHSADHTVGWTTKAMRFFLEQFERYRKGEPLLNVVKKELGY